MDIIFDFLELIALISWNLILPGLLAASLLMLITSWSGKIRRNAGRRRSKTFKLR